MILEEPVIERFDDGETYKCTILEIYEDGHIKLLEKKNWIVHYRKDGSVLAMMNKLAMKKIKVATKL